MHFRGVLRHCAALLLAAVLGVPGAATADGADDSADWRHLLTEGITARQQGNTRLSIDLLAKAVDRAPLSGQPLAESELGASLLRANRIDEAEALLKRALEGASEADKIRVGVDLGNVALARKDRELARSYYLAAENSSALGAGERLTATLNRARAESAGDRAVLLQTTLQKIDAVDNGALRARLYLNLGDQAARLGLVETAYRAIRAANSNAATLGGRLALEAQDALAQLYEQSNRSSEALQLTEAALRTGAADGSIEVPKDLLFQLHWRKGRMLRVQGRLKEALEEYRLAAGLLESIRQDIPIEYEDGRSSYQYTLRPVFTGFADLTLITSNGLPRADEQQALRAAVHAIELTKQSEMQDYLGNRCEVEAAEPGNDGSVPSGTAVIYQVLLPDRLELLIETSEGLIRKSVAVSESSIAGAAERFVRDLQEYWAPMNQRDARQLYEWLFAPLEEEITKRDIRTLVVVPDGALRLVPMAALIGPRGYLVERYAMTTVAGMSMTTTSQTKGRRYFALLAGLSELGPVVSKLPLSTLGGDLPITKAEATASAENRAIRSMQVRTSEAVPMANVDRSKQQAKLKERLALPGVKEEVASIKEIIPSFTMMDQAFTRGQFTQESASGTYRILHVASHGIFGGSASTSYLLTYDDLLTMDSLDTLLRSPGVESNPIELLTLSACETAEGNERAPLGIAGVAIKARARSVLGSLWPLSDDAAQQFMRIFYDEMIRHQRTKAEALRAAQVELLKDPRFAHPFFWGPFVLIGNWQ